MMPRIPRVEAPQVAIGAQPTPYWDPNAGRGAFGEAMSEGAAALGQGLQQLGEGVKKAQDEADAAAVERALADYGERLNSAELTHRQLQGEKALEGFQPLVDDLRGQRATILDGLANDNQKRAFGLRSDLLLHHSTRSMEAHQSQQIEALHDQAYAANEKTTLDSLKLHANDADVFAPHGAAQSAVDTYLGTNLAKELDRKGVAAEMRAEATAEWKRKAYGTMLQAMIEPPDGSRPNAARARDFYQAHSADLGPDLGEHYGKIVREMDLKQRVEDSVSAIAQKNSFISILPDGTQMRRINGPAMIDAIEQTKTTEDEKGRMRQLGDGIATRAEAQWEHTKKSVYNGALSQYLQSGSLAGISPAAWSWMLDPKNDAASLAEALKRLAQADQEHRRQLRNRDDDTPDQYARAMALQVALHKLKSEQPEEYAKLTAGDVLGMAAAQGLGAHGRKEVTRAWAENAKGLDNADPTRPLPKETSDYVIEALRKAYDLPEQKQGKFDPLRPSTWAEKTTPSGVQASVVALQAQNELRAWRVAHPKATPEELERQADVILAEKAKVTVQAPWYRRMMGTQTVEQEVSAIEARAGRLPPVGTAPEQKPPLNQPTQVVPPPTKTASRPQTELVPPGIPSSFVNAVRAKAGGKALSPSQWDALWAKNKATWGK